MAYMNILFSILTGKVANMWSSMLIGSNSIWIPDRFNSFNKKKQISKKFSTINFDKMLTYIFHRLIVFLYV